MYNLTGFQRDMLYCVAAVDEPTGVEVGQEVEDSSIHEMTRGRLYSNLDYLAEEGLLKKGKKNNRANKYCLTTKGKKALKERRKWENNKLEGANIDVEKANL